MEVYVAVGLLFGPPHVVVYVIALAHFIEELVKEVVFYLTVGVLLGCGEGEGDETEAEFYPAAFGTAVDFFIGGQKQHPLAGIFDALSGFVAHDAVVVVAVGEAGGLAFFDGHECRGGLALVPLRGVAIVIIEAAAFGSNPCVVHTEAGGAYADHWNLCP